MHIGSLSVGITTCVLILLAIEALLYEKEEIDKANITLYWEKKNIYVCKMKKKNTYKILFGEKND